MYFFMTIEARVRGIQSRQYDNLLKNHSMYIFIEGDLDKQLELVKRLRSKENLPLFVKEFTLYR